MRSYLHVLAIPRVGRLLAAATLTYLSTAMLGITVAVGVAQSRGSLAEAGLVLTAHALSVAACAPIAGRLADWLGARRAVITYLPLHASAYVLLGWTLAGSGSLVIVAAALAGATAPPTAAVVRSHLPVVIPTDRLNTGYALISVTNSATFVAGPPLAGLLSAVASPTFALAICGAARLAGDLAVAATRNLATGKRGAPKGLAGRGIGPLADRQVRILLIIIAADTFGYGSLDMVAVSFGKETSHTAGLLLGALSAGEVVGGLIYGSRNRSTSLRTQLVALHLLTVVVLAAAGAIAAVPLIGLFYLAAGTVSGARDALGQLILSESAPPAYRTETFAWLNTFMWAGFALGTTVSGQLLDRTGVTTTLLVAAGVAVLAAGGASVLRTRTPAKESATRGG
ncbi:MFS transporter [Kribbella sp. CA-294648]|uniref:MFS transporter n=1 Tax=Kribbella sp. CA-294648 TaxID=3239948 RepID=UPI003D8C06DD